MSGLVSTWMGDHQQMGKVKHLGMKPVTQGNLAWTPPRVGTMSTSKDFLEFL